MQIRSKIIFSFLLISIFSAISVFAQKPPAKKNARPTTGNPSKKTSDTVSPKKDKPVYFYHFAQPKFLISKIVIEHDENGLGKIAFQKQKFDEDITEPLALSTATLEKLKGFWTTLKFLTSEETYQSEIRDYGHLGNIKLEMKKDGKERTTGFNWTENLDAKALAEEYRKIANQLIWMFDINIARVNQPLEAPRIMNGLDSYLRRDAISDPQQMLPFLKGLSEDERIPLIARNHAGRLMKKIESSKKKTEDSIEEK